MTARIRLSPEHAAALVLGAAPAALPPRHQGAARVYRLPWPVSVNAYYRAVVGANGSAHVILSRAARIYRQRVAHALIEQRARAAPPGRLALSVEAHPPADGRLHDIDNILKCLCDALMHAGVYPCDGAIDRIALERLAETPGGLVVVRIEPYLPRKE